MTGNVPRLLPCRQKEEFLTTVSDRYYTEATYQWNEMKMLLNTVPNTITRKLYEHGMRKQEMRTTVQNGSVRKNPYNAYRQHVKTRVSVLHLKQDKASIPFHSSFLFFLRPQFYNFLLLLGFSHYQATLELININLISGKTPVI